MRSAAIRRIKTYGLAALNIRSEKKDLTASTVCVQVVSTTRECEGINPTRRQTTESEKDISAQPPVAGSRKEK